MGLYNTLFGVNPMSSVLLACLGLKREDVPRFRDAYVSDGKIVIYTRTGGGNREYYESLESCKANCPESFTGEDDPSGPWNDDLRANPHFVSDEDDDFDSTYAYFHFKFPDDYRAELEKMAANTATITPSEKWKVLLENLSAGAAKGE